MLYKRIFVIGVALWALGGTTAEAQCPCDPGSPSTITGSGFILGTPGDDCIQGSAGVDVILGRGGNDVVCAGDGDDQITTLGGDDIIFGEGGNDTISAGDGTNEVNGGDGADTISTGSGLDSIEGGDGADTINAGDGADTVFGGPGDDEINGQGGDDFLVGGTFQSFIDPTSEMTGDDNISGGDGSDSIYGFDGNDTISADAGDDFQVFGGAGDDTIFGGDGADILDGEEGADHIIGGAGDDVIFGGDGGDILQGCGGFDDLNGEGGDDFVYGDGCDAGSEDGIVDDVGDLIGGDTCGFNSEDSFKASCTTLTPASIDNVLVKEDAGAFVLEFTTTSEAGTIGYEIRDEAGNVLGFLPSNQESPLGGQYAIRLEERPSTVQFIERTIDRDIRHDLRPALYSANPTWLGAAYAWNSQVRALQPTTPPVVRHVISRGAADAAAFEVVGDHLGLAEIRFEQLATALGVDVTEVTSAAAAGNLEVRTSNGTVAWRAVEQGLQVVTHGTRDAFANARTYFIEIGAGHEMATAAGVVASIGSGVAARNVHLEEQSFPGTVSLRDGRQDLFFWANLIAGATGPFETALPATGDTTIRLNVHGSSPGLNHFRVLVDGAEVGRGTVEAFEASTLELSANLSESTLRVEAVAAPEGTMSSLYVDSVDLSFLGTETAIDGFATANAAEGRAQVSGLIGGDVLAFEVSDVNAPTFLGEVATTDGVVAVSDVERLFVAEAATSVELRPVYFADVPADANYIIVAAEHLASSASRLAEYRNARGLRSAVVSMRDLRDTFAAGANDPAAINAQLQALVERGQDLEGVVLLGQGTFDYRGILGAESAIPSTLLATGAGLMPADMLLGDVDHDGTPDLPLGRIPVAEDAEFDGYLARLARFESRSERTFFGFSDTGSEALDFGTGLADVAQMMGMEHSILSPSESIDEDHAAVLEGVSNADIVTYAGHGGLDRLSDRRLLTTADVESLTEVGGIFSAWTCNINRFDIPSFESLGAAMVARGGAVAVVASAGWSEQYQVTAPREAFFAGLAASKSLGESTLDALQAGGEGFSAYNLLGDPAITPNAPADASPAPFAPGINGGVRPVEVTELPAIPGENLGDGVFGIEEISGCSTGGAPSGGFLIALAGLFFVRRRRR